MYLKVHRAVLKADKLEIGKVWTEQSSYRLGTAINVMLYEKYIVFNFHCASTVQSGQDTKASKGRPVGTFMAPDISWNEYILYIFQNFVHPGSNCMFMRILDILIIKLARNKSICTAIWTHFLKHHWGIRKIQLIYKTKPVWLCTGMTLGQVAAQNNPCTVLAGFQKRVSIWWIWQACVARSILLAMQHDVDLRFSGVQGPMFIQSGHLVTPKVAQGGYLFAMRDW